MVRFHCFREQRLHISQTGDVRKLHVPKLNIFPQNRKRRVVDDGYPALREGVSVAGLPVVCLRVGVGTEAGIGQPHDGYRIDSARAPQYKLWTVDKTPHYPRSQTRTTEVIENTASRIFCSFSSRELLRPDIARDAARRALSRRNVDSPLAPPEVNAGIYFLAEPSPKMFAETATI